MGVADEDEFSVCVPDATGERGELSGADHGGFVDDDDGADVEFFTAL